MPDCLKGCIADFSTGTNFVPVDAEIVAPWVKVTFGEGENAITVGNKSSPSREHHAIIKYFEYGTHDGMRVQVEILDEEGGSLSDVFEEMFNDVEEAKEKYRAIAEWGWVVSNCDGSTSIVRSTKIPWLATDLAINFSSSVVKYTISGNDLLQVVFVSRKEEIYGTDDNRMTLKQAIQQLLTREEPIMNVSFLRKNNSGVISEWNFPLEFNNGDGPEGVWDSDGQNKLNTIQKWLEPFLTEDSKGITASWDTTATEPTLILWEDLSPPCDEPISAQRIVGTFLVNAGDCSNVLDFSPNINWVGALGALETGGAAGTAATAKTEDKDVPGFDINCPVQTKDTGVIRAIPVTRQAWDAWGPGLSVEKTNEAQPKHNKAGLRFEISKGHAITAELKFQGDPSLQFVDSKTMHGKYVSIVVINPFHLRVSDSIECGDWLANPTCNPILSNKTWQIQKCVHQIKEGSYTTTLGLQLPTPNFDLPKGAPLGGQTSN